MLDESERAEVPPSLEAYIRALQMYHEQTGARLSEARERISDLACGTFEPITGRPEANYLAIYYHHLSIYGPPCGKCGKFLLTSQAALCANCGFRTAQSRVGVMVDKVLHATGGTSPILAGQRAGSARYFAKSIGASATISIDIRLVQALTILTASHGCMRTKTPRANLFDTPQHRPGRRGQALPRSPRRRWSFECQYGPFGGASSWLSDDSECWSPRFWLRRGA
jgi:hypothetical protein